MTRPVFHTLSEARDWLLAHRAEGCTCPCCGQLAKVYRRKLNYAMAHVLILMYEYFSKPEHSGTWLHLPTYLNGRGVVARGGDPTKLRYWGLIIGSGEVRDDDSPRVGHWRITHKGIAFVERRISVPAYALVYDEECLGFSEELTTIDAALGKRFDYAKLMEGLKRPRMQQGSLFPDDHG